MPIIRISDQKDKTLEEFYKELTSGNATVVENEIGSAMLSFIAMTNKAFPETILYGLTSLFALVIQPADNWAGDWFVTVRSIGGEGFQIEYKLPDAKSPWVNARVKGEAKNLEEAITYLIIAMAECEGWRDNKELKTLCKKLKTKKEE